MDTVPMTAGRARAGHRGVQHEEHLLTVLGSDPALTHYARHLLAASPRVRLIVSEWTRRRLRASDNGSPQYAMDVRVGPPAFRRIEEMLVVDAARLPDLDAEELWQLHRHGGAPVTVLFDCARADYCQERLAIDGPGSVCGAFRNYSDSPGPQEGAQTAQSSLQGKVPIAVALNKSACRALARLEVWTFDELVELLCAEGERLFGRVDWVRTRAARLTDDPLERLLRVVERCGRPYAIGTATHPNCSIDPSARLSGPLLIGRNVHIDADAVIIGPAALGDNVRIGAGTVISRSVLLPGTVVQASRCHSRCILRGRLGRALYESSRYAAAAASPCGTEHSPIAVQKIPLVKRCFDRLAAVVGLVALSPLLAALALAVKVTSPGPVLYRHRRQGLGGVEFDCLKFRTMIPGAEQLQAHLRQYNEVDGPQFKMGSDPRITPIGAFLRRTNLDELPQLINVLRGQMSLVGPRPSPDCENQFCPVWRKNRLSVLPGITGLWQVTRSPDRKLDFQEWIHYDLQYINNQSFWLDIQIIWQTIRTVVSHAPSARWCRRWRPTRPSYDACGPAHS